MHRFPTRLLSISACISVVVTSLFLAVTFAASPANEHFLNTWERTDGPVAEGHISRTWMWGPTGFTGSLQEQYVEAPDGMRTVQYFDKSRMEITTNQDVSPQSPWYVTNGLLVVELISGGLQVGDTAFDYHVSAEINVAGDADDPHGPTYATFSELLHAPTVADGTSIIQRVDRQGNVWQDPNMADYGATAAHRVTIDGIDHQIASSFWDFMNSSGPVFSNGQLSEGQLFPNPFYATGYPITEAYWASVKVGGVTTDVLMQCFERRCLTFTPGNSLAWQVEAGNVGQHYHSWRYSLDVDEKSPENPSPPVNTQTPTATVSLTQPPSSSAPPQTSPPANQPSPTSTPTPPAEDPIVYVTDWDNRVVRFGTHGSLIDQWGGKGTGQGRFDLPHGIAVDPEGNVYVSDYGNHQVQKFSSSGTFLSFVGGEGDGSGKLRHPVAVATDGDGNLYISDASNSLIQKFNSTGDFILQWGGYGNSDAHFKSVAGVAIGPSGHVYVVDEGSHEVKQFDASGNYIEKWGTFGDRNGEFDSPHSIAVGPNGDVYIGDIGNSRIQRFDSTGEFLNAWGQMGAEEGEFHTPYGVAVATNGDVYVLDYGYARIQVFSANGQFKRDWGGYDASPANLQSPWGIALAHNHAGSPGQPQDPPPTKQPEDSPSPTPTPPPNSAVPPLSNAYLLPEGAVLSVLNAQCNCQVSLSNPIVQHALDRAYLFRHQYHLATAPVGSFNRDTTGFYAWLEGHLTWNDIDDDFHQHLMSQVYTAIYQPTSQIGIQLRMLEAGQDPLFAEFGAGPITYWTYLVDPAIRLRINPVSYETFENAFYQHLLDYQAKLASDPTFGMWFGDYLASIEYNMYGLLTP